jgi:uncharacterized phage protein (TIGR02216 family)
MMLPWPSMMRAANSAGVPPRHFWRLSLREWRWLAGTGARLDRRAFEQLMKNYPDTEETNG